MWVRVRGTLGDRGTKGYHIRIPHLVVVFTVIPSPPCHVKHALPSFIQKTNIGHLVIGSNLGIYPSHSTTILHHIVNYVLLLPFILWGNVATI